MENKDLNPMQPNSMNQNRETEASMDEQSNATTPFSNDNSLKPDYNHPNQNTWVDPIYSSPTEPVNPHYSANRNSNYSAPQTAGPYFYNNPASEQSHLSYQEIKAQKQIKKQRRGRWASALAFILALSLTFAGSFQLGSYYGERRMDEKLEQLKSELQSAPQNSLDSEGKVISHISSAASPVVSIAEQVVPSVVTITSTVNSTIRNPFFGNQSQSYRESGSGVIYKSDEQNAYIITNHHVIENGSSIQVSFYNEENATAEVMGYDSKNDLAVLKIRLSDLKNKDLVVANFGDSNALKVGQLAVAIGNPLGAGHDHTITSGIISSINRTLDIENIKGLEVIQTDAAINPGNSGGALVNEFGQVIGINTAKYLDVKVEGMGFAIPSNIVLSVVEKIVKNGSGDAAYALSDDRPFLGIGFSNINQEIYTQSGIPFGVYVTKVYQHSAADQAGVREGDILFSLNGIRIKDSNMLFDTIGKLELGQSIRIGLVREDKVFEVETTITSFGEVNSKNKNEIQ